MKASSRNFSRRIRRRLIRVPQWILAVVIVLVGIRAALPWGIERYLNDILDSIPGYYGKIDDVDLAIWRGAYSIEGLNLVKTDGDSKEPLFSADAIDFSVDWRALIHGRLVSKVFLYSPKLQFIERASKGASQTKVDESWQDKLKSFFPLEINRFVIRDGLIRYKDETSRPKINFFMDRLQLNAENLTNATSSEEKLPSTVALDARLMSSGRSKLNGRINVLEQPMLADVKASVRELDLKELNEFAKAYGNFDFEKGTFGLTLELAASKSRYEGYAKTILRDVDVVDLKKDKGDSLGRLAWEGTIGALMTIFKHHRRDQFAARIPISGSRKEIEIDKWSTVGSILQNTFVRAMSPQFEDSVRFESLAKKGPSKDGTESGASRPASDEEEVLRQRGSAFGKK